MSNFTDVGDFHEKFDLHRADSEPGPIDVPDGLMDFRIRFLQEELAEYIDGVVDRDLAGMADALVDIVYVALGTAHLLGLPWNELWDDVQRANMTKERASADGANSKRNSPFDVVKPEGWIGPHTKEILEKHGFVV